MMNLALTGPVPWNCQCPSLQNEQSEFHSGICDLSPCRPRCLILALPSWLSIKNKSEIQGEKGGKRKARTEEGRKAFVGQIISV